MPGLVSHWLFDLALFNASRMNIGRQWLLLYLDAWCVYDSVQAMNTEPHRSDVKVVN